jgi:hypothetical protein
MTWTGAALAAGVAIVSAAAVSAAVHEPAPAIVQFVFTSDAHYGLSRASFRGATNVDASIVNGALVAAINSLPHTRFPDDAGLRAGQMIGGLDFVIEGGDIANREEVDGSTSIQPASTSWSQFVHDYVDRLHTTDASGASTRLFVVPGNHEASNAVGFYKRMGPPTDNTAIVQIFNRMLRPAVPLDAASYQYDRDRVFFTADVRGLHFEFLHVWPDSVMRRDMEQDLHHVSPTTPVVVVAHDQPDAEAKHFINPNGAHDVNATDQFENLLADRFEDGPSRTQPSTLEQAELEQFLAAHPNITTYLHGNSNWHQVYEWNGPHHTARLHVVRSDSPMKGDLSSFDETKMSFEVVSADAIRQTMTVRECLWNQKGAATSGCAWGDSVSFTIAPPQRRSGS